MSMSSVQIGIVDYGMGNVYSILQACGSVGADARLCSTPLELKQFDAIILPGVGGFPYAMQQLRAQGLDVAIRDLAVAGTPILGICLGMQLLFRESNEFSLTEGLGILPGDVRSIRLDACSNVPIRVPHIGWSPLLLSEPRDALFVNLPHSPYMYFVHSYYVRPTMDSIICANVSYEQFRYACAVRSANVVGVQFHPERSGPDGLTIYSNWLNEIKEKRNG